MVRIGGGVFPDIKEPDYLGERGYTIDDKAGKVMHVPLNLFLILKTMLWLLSDQVWHRCLIEAYCAVHY